MTQINMIKRAGVLMPATEEDERKLGRFASGSLVSGEYRQVRNPQFHRKFFALLNLGFEAFEPEATHHGRIVQKDFDRFRKDCIIQAGFYDLVANLKCEVRADAKSISFGSMSEDEFGRVYNAVANVILQRVLTNYTRDDLDEVIEKVIEF